jgi:hypothetical protein
MLFSFGSKIYMLQVIDAEIGVKSMIEKEA